MIPSIGELANSGSMPISASGGQAGPSSATSHASFGGIKNGSINFGHNSGPWLFGLALAIGGTWWLCTH